MTDAGWRLGVLLLGYVVACGQTEFEAEPGGTGGVPGTGGAGAAPSGGAPSGGAGGSVGGGLPLPRAECVVAVHADQCCTPPVAVSAAVMATNPCLVPYGLQSLPAAIRACPDAERCLMVDCISPAPPSRIAAPDPDAGGACRFVDECATLADCVVATDLRGCCGCPTVFPRALALANPCISPPGPPAGLACNTCGPVVCGACLTPNPGGSCTEVGEYLTCMEAGTSVEP